MNIVDTFKKNIGLVNKLINFDRQVLDIAIKSISDLHTNLRDKQDITNPKMNGQRTLETLKTIRTNDSLKIRYEIINNQAVILLVSYFASAIADLFKEAVKIAVDIHKDEKVLNVELKVKVDEFLTLGDSSGDIIGDLLISKDSLSFQDMKSIQREFKKYFGISIEKDINVNNIILSQACRHAISHEAGIVNARVMNQVKSAVPRELKESLIKDSEIHFESEEIDIISSSMLIYIQSLSEKVRNYEEGI